MLVKKNVLKLQVIVSKAFLVNVMDCDNELVSIEARNLLTEATSMLEVVKELTTISKFTDNHCHPTFFFLLAQNSTFFVVDHFANIWVLQLPLDLDLSLDLLSSGAVYLNDLGRVSVVALLSELHDAA